MNSNRVRRLFHFVCVSGRILFCFLVTSMVQFGNATIPLPPNQELLAIHASGPPPNPNNNELFRIDTLTGVATLIGETPFDSLQSLATRQDGTLFAWDRNVGLVTIDPVTAQGYDVNLLVDGRSAPLFQSIAFSSSGDLFGITTIGGGDAVQHALYEINSTTGVPSIVGSTPILEAGETIRGIEFVGNRLVGVAWDFASPSSPFLDINPSTGAVTQIGLTGTKILNSLAQDSQGLLYSVQSITGAIPSSTLVTLDPATGATIDSLSITAPGVAPNGFSVRGLTIRTVPEASTAVLFLSALLVVTNRTGRRETRN